MRTDFILGLILPHRVCRASLGTLPSGLYVLRSFQSGCGKQEPLTASCEPRDLSLSPLPSPGLPLSPHTTSVLTRSVFAWLSLCLFRLEGSWQLTLDPSGSLIKNNILFWLTTLEILVYSQLNLMFWGL